MEYNSRKREESSRTLRRLGVAPTTNTLWANTAELELELRQFEPSTRLVTERQILRVLSARHARGESLSWNSRLPVVADRAELLGLELPASVTDGSEPQRILLTSPEARLLHNSQDDEIRTHYRYQLDRVQFARLLRSGSFTDAECEKQFQTLPESVQREIRYILESEGILTPTAPEAALFRQFGAMYAELCQNRPQALADYFPLFVASGVDARTLFSFIAAPAGKPVAVPVPPAHPEPAPPVPSELRNPARMAMEYYQRTEDRALAAAILREGLGGALATVLNTDTTRKLRWNELLLSLLRHTGDGKWPPAAKTLYELQKLTLDFQQKLYAVAPIEYLTSGGKQPLRQSLEPARDVILLQHFAKVRKQLHRVALSEHEQTEAEELISHEVHSAEKRIDATYRPILRKVLDEATLVPSNRVETIAREKLISELLDMVASRGFFRFSDLRDAIARNPLKLPDFASVRQYRDGDALLQADRILGRELFGVYQRGEIYLRGIQRMSGAAFGTQMGRWFTLFLFLPFVGAFLTLEFLQHVVHGILGLASVVGLIAPHAKEESGGAGPHLVTWWSTLLLGGFFLGLLHSPPFRDRIGKWVGTVGRGSYRVFVELPSAILSSRIVQRLARHPLTQYLRRVFAFPILVGLLSAGIATLYDVEPWQSVVSGTIAFAVSLVFVHSPAGRRLYEFVAESVIDTGRFIWASLIPGLISSIVWAFREIATAVERVLYAVDEWLRFREGQSRESLGLKCTLAVVWFPIAYVVRFVFYLLIEPQVNPVKHFPVVTVSHKVIWPMVLQLSRWTGISPWTMSMIVNGIPGIFGFMAWELKENWRLYAANRPDRLRPVSIGHHGETLRSLLRPGFHSGTIPKLYRKLRAIGEGGLAEAKKSTRLHEELHHAEEAVRRLIERDFLPLVSETAAEVESITLGCQRVEVRLKHATVSRPLVLAWELRDGAVLSEIAAAGWLAEQAEPTQKRLLYALAGLNAYAAVSTPEPPLWTDWVAQTGTNPTA
jgi:hypothetical protein